MEFSADNLERAVCQFYQSGTTAQAQAHQWLTAAKISPQAWGFVWELLQPQKVNFKKIYFLLLYYRFYIQKKVVFSLTHSKWYCSKFISLFF